MQEVFEQIEQNAESVKTTLTNGTQRNSSGLTPTTDTSDFWLIPPHTARTTPLTPLTRTALRHAQSHDEDRAEERRDRTSGGRCWASGGRRPLKKTRMVESW